jgi:hypothetical protein
MATLDASKLFRALVVGGISMALPACGGSGGGGGAGAGGAGGTNGSDPACDSDASSKDHDAESKCGSDKDSGVADKDTGVCLNTATDCNHGLCAW